MIKEEMGWPRPQTSLGPAGGCFFSPPSHVVNTQGCAGLVLHMPAPGGQACRLLEFPQWSGRRRDQNKIKPPMIMEKGPSCPVTTLILQEKHQRRRLGIKPPCCVTSCFISLFPLCFCLPCHQSCHWCHPSGHTCKCHKGIKYKKHILYILILLFFASPSNAFWQVTTSFFIRSLNKYF